MTKLSKEVAQQMYDSGIESIKQFALDNYPELAKKQLVKSWEGLVKVGGFYVDYDSDIGIIDSFETIYCHRNIFKTKEQAEASIALAMLTQLMADANGDWVADWRDIEKKYTLEFYEDELSGYSRSSCNFFLSFPTAEIRDAFLENHRELILKAKPLLG